MSQPTTKETQEMIYRRRVELEKLREGKSLSEIVDIANNPEYYREIPSISRA